MRNATRAAMPKITRAIVNNAQSLFQVERKSKTGIAKMNARTQSMTVDGMNEWRMSK
jgi:hypothetical protein